MRQCFTLVLFVSAASALSAEPLLISAQVLDRADNGAPVRELFVYPSVVLEPGEKAELHIGPELQFPFGTQRVELGEGVSAEETVYQTLPVGLSFELSYTREGGTIRYSAEAESSVSLGGTETTSEIARRHMLFFGETELGGLVEAQFESPNGTDETIKFHFGPAPEDE